MSASALFEVFVGRDAEADRLLRSFERAACEERGSSILISGESGVGKSRLLHEFALRLESRRHVFLTGRCMEYVQTPYGALIDAFKSEREGSVIDRALRGGSDERRGTAADERSLRFGRVRDAIKRRSAVTGVLVLALEDLQWSDAALLDLLRYLTYELKDSPVVILSTVRTEEVERRPSIAAAIAKLLREGAVELEVGPLPREEIARAVRATAPEARALTAADLSGICELAEGRPMVAEELLRGMLDGATKPVVRGLHGIRAMLLDRLEQFGEAQQTLLMQAAVAGREFDVALLVRISGLAEETVLAALRQARNAQIVRERSQPGAFEFRHAIAREILYHELLAPEARVLHRRIAVALEAFDPEGRADEIAYHWWAAHDAERALRATAAAGDRAAAIFAFGDAAQWYERALDFAAERTETRLSLLEKVTYAACTQGDLVRARAYCERAADEAAALGRDESAQRLTLWLARQIHESGESADALVTIDRVIDASAGDSGSPVPFAARMTKAAILALLGRAEEALALTESLERDAVEEPVERFRGENARGNAFSYLGRYEEAIDAYRRALAIAETLEDTDLLLHAWNSLAGVAALLGRATEAVATYESARRVAGERGFRRMELRVAASLAFAHLCAGDLSQARALVATYGSDRSGSPAPRVFMQGVAIRLAAFDANFDAGGDSLDFAVEAAFSSGNETLVEIVAGAAAHFELARGNAVRARALVERALGALRRPAFAYWLVDAASVAGPQELRDRASAIVDRSLERGATEPARACRSLLDARAYAASGDDERAARLARRAYELFAKFPWPYEAAQALEAAADLTGALNVYRRMGARRAILRLEERLGKRPALGKRKSALTRREEQVGVLVRRGYTNKAVAEELNIGERTVETHVASLYRKLGVKTRVELASRLDRQAP
jgi:DNA-binding CsgD family transcriptional regulator/predicted negative regulator of RcsB-dependent stress response